jgi:hypothetical protein
MVLLTLERDSGCADRARAYHIVLDGKTIGNIRDGETKEMSVSLGEHDLSVRIDWTGSRTLHFSAAKGQPVAFRVKSNIRGPRLILGVWYLLFAWNSYLHLEQIN